VVTLRIPPLRERSDDIPLLADHFLRIYCEEHGREPKTLAPEAVELLRRSPWPGNVRELRNVIESTVIFHTGTEVKLQDLPAEHRAGVSVSAAGAPVQPLAGDPRRMAEIERQAILETLERTGGHRARAADLLDIGLRTLQRKLKEYKDQGFYKE
jgi:DNA-binding NtrC family response regulator